MKRNRKTESGLRRWLRCLVRIQVLFWPRWWVRPTLWKPQGDDAMRYVYKWCFHCGPLEIRRFINANVKEQTGEALSDSHCLTRLVRVGDSVMARNGAEGMVREVCGIGVWIDCKDPALFSDRGNPIGVDWKDIISHANATAQTPPDSGTKNL